MSKTSLDSRMRSMELFHSLRAPLDNWLVLRIDGRSFSRLTSQGFEKPFDERFHQAMVVTTSALVQGFTALYGYTESDEISLLFGPDWTQFDREIEKLVSLSAALASATFALEVQRVVQFDSRCWCAGQTQSVVDYFRWRQGDAARCCLNGWCYWVLRQEGKTKREATAALFRASFAQKNEMLFQRGINFNDLPAWQRRGTGVYWSTYEKEGLNPKTGERVTALRRGLKVDRELPLKGDYSEFIQRLCTPGIPACP